MASTTTKTRTIRMSNEAHEWLSGTDARVVIEGVYGLWERGVVEVSGGELIIRGSGCVQGANERLENELRDTRARVKELESENTRLEREMGNLDSERVAELESDVNRLTDEVKALTGEITALKGGENPEISERLLVELRSMAKPNNLTVEKIISDLVERLDSGEIGIGSSGLTVGVVSDCPFNWKELSDAIDSVGSTFDEKIPLVAKAIFQGKI